MVLRLILQSLRRLLSLQAENTNMILQRINSYDSVRDGEEWLHTEDVMVIFKKSERTIYNWRKSGALKYRMQGGTAYYLKSDIYRILDNE